MKELTGYSMDNDLALPNFFDGIDDDPDNADGVMTTDQQISAKLDEEVKTDLEEAYLI